jgi:O-antigen ligase
MAVQSLVDLPLQRETRPISRTETFAPLVKWAYTLFGLAFVYGAFTPVFASKLKNSGFENRQAGDTTFEIISMAIYAASLPFVVVGFKTVWRTLPRIWPLLALLGLTLVSTLWSVQHDVTIRRSIAVILTMLFGYYAATCLTQRQVLTMSAIVLTVILMGSIALIAIGQGSEHAGRHFGDLKGIFNNKNDFGTYLGLTCVLYAFLAVHGSSVLERWACRGLLPMALLLLWGSDARTPLMSAVAAGGFVYVLNFMLRPNRWQRRLALEVRVLFLALGILAGVIVVAAAITIIFSLLGRNLTLTGRVKLWEYAIGLGSQRPWLGAGFKAFWTDAVTFDLRVLHRAWTGNQVGGDPLTGNGHDGYLDMWLELGWVGLGVYVLFLGSFMAKIFRALRKTRDALVQYNAAVLGFMLIFSITESTLLEHSEIAWFMMAYAYMALGRQDVMAPARAAPRRPAPVAPTRALA